MNLWREYALALEAYHDNAMDIAREVDLRTGPSLELLEKQRGLEERLTKTKVDLKTVRDNPIDLSGPLTDAELIVACRNIGFDLTCGACAGQFYTGAQLGEHTCPSKGQPEMPELSRQIQLTIRAETKCKQLLMAIQTATTGDLTDSGRVARYRACLLCRRDLNVCERDYRVCLETDALDRACRGAKVRALISSPLEFSPVSRRVTEVHKSIGKEVPPFETRSQAMSVNFDRIYGTHCIDCDGKGQVRQQHGPDDNHDAADCSTCAGTGLKYPPIQDLARAFHEAFLPEQGTGTDHPHVPPPDHVRLRLKLVFEEAFELLEACVGGASFDPLRKMVEDCIALAPNHVNIVKVADAFADLASVVEGGNLDYGIDSRPVLVEVHRSNMSKVGGHRGESGKWIKPSTYSPPDIASVLKKQGWQP